MEIVANRTLILIYREIVEKLFQEVRSLHHYIIYELACLFVKVSICVLENGRSFHPRFFSIL